MRDFRVSRCLALLRSGIQGAVSSVRAIGLIVVGLSVAMTASGFQNVTRPGPAVRPFINQDAAVIALQHARIIDGTGKPAAEDQTVIIRNGRIAAVGSAASTSVPADAKVIDLAGFTVLPGMVGMHEHLYYPAPGGQPAMYPEHISTFPALYLAGGVTTARTAGSVEPYTDLEIKRAIEQGLMVGPKFNVTGPYLEGQGSFAPQMHTLKDADDATRTVNYWMDEGVGSFKAYMHITPDELSAAVKAAHARGIKVTGHLCSIGFREAAAIGIDNLEHGVAVDTEFFSGKAPGVCPGIQAPREMADKLDIQGPAVQEMIRDLVAHHVAITSTLPVFETFVAGRAPLARRVLDAMTPEARIAYLTSRAGTSDAGSKSYWPVLFKKEMEFERSFVKAGGMLLAGLDPTGYGGVIAGFGDQREVELLVEAGFTPLEAIHIATSNGAEFLGLLNQVGTVEAGKAADLIIVRGNPSVNINDIENVDTVFKDGIGYDSAKLIDSVKGLVGLR